MNMPVPGDVVPSPTQSEIDADAQAKFGEPSSAPPDAELPAEVKARAPTPPPPIERRAGSYDYDVKNPKLYKTRPISPVPARKAEDLPPTTASAFRDAESVAFTDYLLRIQADPFMMYKQPPQQEFLDRG